MDKEVIEEEQLVNAEEMESFFTYWEEIKQNNYNTKEHDQHVKDLENMYNELSDKGVIACFKARSDNKIFRENGLKSNDVAEMANICNQFYNEIQKACNYDLSNPIEVDKWLSSLAPYLNDSNLPFDNLISSNITDLSNPIDEILISLEQQGYDKNINPAKFDEDLKHNEIVSAYNIIKSGNFVELDEQEIDKQLNIIKPYIDENLVLTSNQVKAIPNSIEKAKKIKNSILKNGVIETITNILEQNGYGTEVEKEIINFKMDGQDNYQAFFTDRVFNKMNIYLKYLQIKEYGFLIEELSKSFEAEELVMNQLMNTEDIQDYISIMKKRKDDSPFQEKTEDKEKENISKIGKIKIALPAFVERFFNKRIKQEEKKNQDEQEILNIIADIENASNIDSFAYALRTSKNYINNPSNSLNLSDGRNIIQIISNKAEELNITFDKSTQDLVKGNPAMNEVLVHYVKNQIDDLYKYGCFLTSKCNDQIEQKKIKIDKVDSVLIPSVTREKQLPAVIFDMNPIYEAAFKSGTPQTKEETEIIVSMLNASVEPTKGNIEKAKEMVKQLPAVIKNDTQLAIIKEWDMFEKNKKEAQIEIAQETEIENNTKQESITLSNANQIIEKLVEYNNIIIDKTGIDKGMRIVEIQDEISILDSEIENISNSNVFEDEEKNKKLQKALDKKRKNEETTGAILYGISQNKENETINMSDAFKNEIAQNKEKLNKILIEIKEKSSNTNQQEKSIIEEFKENYEKREQDREKIDKRKKSDKEKADIMDACLYDYKQIDRLYQEFTREIEKANKKHHTSSKLETVVSNITTYIDSIESKISNEELETIQQIKDIVIQKQGIVGLQEKVFEIHNATKELIENEVFTEEDQKIIDEAEELKTAKQEQINTKKLVLQQEETMLSFSPDIAKKELEELINKSATQEEIALKIDELLVPIKSTEVLKESLQTEIEELEKKIQDNSNYIDEEKVALEQDKLSIFEKQLEFTNNKEKELEEQLKEQQDIEHLNELKTILLKEQKSREEDKEILMRWSIQEAESSDEVRKIITDLQEETNVRMEKTNSELAKCEEELKTKEVKEEENSNHIKEELEELKKSKKELEDKIEYEKTLIEDKKDSSLLDNNAKLSDQDLLNSKKKELEQLSDESLDRMKEEILAEYNSELSKETPFELPGELIDGTKINSYGSLEKPLGLPNKEEIEDIKEASPVLLEKAKQKFKECGKKVLDWVKNHPKLAAALGAIVATVTVAGVIIIKSLSGQELDTANNMVLPEDDIIEATNNNEANQEKTDIEEAIDNAIDEMEQEESINEDLTEEEENTRNYQEVFENVKKSIIDGDLDIYRTASNAQNDTSVVSHDKLYMPSFESSNIDEKGLFADTNNDGSLERITKEEASDLIQNGEQVIARVNNNGIGIGWTSINSDEQQENKGISR